jgi:hypothetical protein
MGATNEIKGTNISLQLEGKNVLNVFKNSQKRI